MLGVPFSSLPSPPGTGSFYGHQLASGYPRRVRAVARVSRCRVRTTEATEIRSDATQRVAPSSGTRRLSVGLPHQMTQQLYKAQHKTSFKIPSHHPPLRSSSSSCRYFGLAKFDTILTRHIGRACRSGFERSQKFMDYRLGTVRSSQ